MRAAVKRSSLSVGAKSLQRGGTFKQRYARQLAGASKGFAASPEQRAKARGHGCRVHGGACGNADPMHITPRSVGGCDDALCVVPCCRELHRLYDIGRFDASPYLTRDEAAHAVQHLGLFGALRRITNQRWTPERAA